MITLQKLSIFAVSCFCFATFAAGTIHAAPVVYPAKGQSQEQQSKDEGECHQWAIKNTGVDPAQLAAEASSSKAPQQQHSVVGGAARGALVGVAIGAVAGDAGKGAAIGATAGGLGGGIRGRRDLANQQQAADNASGQQQAQLQEYYRAYEACLSGKGYSVK